MITIIDRDEKRVVSQIRCSKFIYDWSKESRYVLSPSDNAVCLTKTWEVVEDYATFYEAIEGLLSYYKQEYEERNTQQVLCFTLSQLMAYLPDGEALELSIANIENCTSFYLVDHDRVEIDRVTLFDVAERAYPQYEFVGYRYGWVWGLLCTGGYEPILQAATLPEAESLLYERLQPRLDGKPLFVCQTVGQAQTEVMHAMRKLVLAQKQIFDGAAVMVDDEGNTAPMTDSLLDRLEQHTRELARYMQEWDEFVSVADYEEWE